MRSTLDAPAVLRWCELGVDRLAAARDEIDALNVFPVADRDTGTNLLLTVEAAAAAARSAAHGTPQPHAEAVLWAMADGALAGARGNSGTIVAQLLRGLAWARESAHPADGADAGATLLAAGLARGVDLAWEAVAEPVEGTILSVAASAAQAAQLAAAQPATTVVDVAQAAVAAAATACVRTTEQLAVLQAAGVVDAGGQGWLVLLQALDVALCGPGAFAPPPAATPRRAPLDSASARRPGGASTPTAYEVTYLIETGVDRIGQLRADLAALGDSVVVSGGHPRWKVHVHVADPGAAVEAGVRAGRPRQVRITRLDEREPVAVDESTRDE